MIILEKKKKNELPYLHKQNFSFGSSRCDLTNAATAETRGTKGRY